jgi:hypothetical protein
MVYYYIFPNEEDISFLFIKIMCDLFVFYSGRFIAHVQVYMHQNWDSNSSPDKKPWYLYFPREWTL